ncbi:16S rRNA m(7)G-527 methyltransferase [Desulfitobacterium dichloroeliminans LMG P-21439]|uniref:Ribosomal RNA small subunit methyltransferase G n=1 Tax=Desulfitobacterium dichloroeliminans (strain LMG P-21439 / DCA1) TaxID=871963 RepID=L0FCG4_DESDL|nr:16S rRNA (guanine(527)-N(7))-methyltransferase RsmG [Desulfitobacterium dichloroeliminans]AGA70912.1 16S rRNA m(7)G-527 methyltransferase [Desulfitobacterium dichloroeliminans LMG P-21439]
MQPEHKDLLRRLSMEMLNLHLSDNQLEQFSVYADRLVEWNKKVNLTSITNPEEIILKHFVDSLSLIPLVAGNKMADIGTGAGFPGLPIKIMLPQLKVYLVDSLAKRLEFLNVVLNELNIQEVETIHSRAEDFARNPLYRETFDCVTSRAVARLPVLLEYAIPLLRTGGVFLAAKGSQVDEEVIEAKKAAEILGAEIKEIRRFSLGEEAEHRAVVVIEKISPTPEAYPRKAGTPAKKPLI